MVESGVTRLYNIEDVWMHESVMHGSTMMVHSIIFLKAFGHVSELLNNAA